MVIDRLFAKTHEIVQIYADLIVNSNQSPSKKQGLI